VTFPGDYGAENLAGKAAVFDVKVKEVRAPKAAVLDDALAAQIGFPDLAALTDAVRGNVERQYEQASRFKLKRALLDALDGQHDIQLPPRMVEAEFAGIWQQVEKDKTDGEVSPEDAGKSDDDLRKEYRKIAERRVRLGLVLAEIGRRDNVQVTEAELGAAMRAEAMQYGAQAQQIFDLMRQNANIQNQMRAPLYEEKVVDLIIGRATVTDKAVSKEDLLKDDDMPEGYGEDAAPAKAKPAVKKAKAKADDAAEAVAEPAAEKPAKAKTPAKPKAAKAKA
jgi:trigger factor